MTKCVTPLLLFIQINYKFVYFKARFLLYELIYSDNNMEEGTRLSVVYRIAADGDYKYLYIYI
jgi:hypothetical protein